MSNKFKLSVYGIGFVGNFTGFIKRNGKHIKEYDCWHSMLRRCYDEKHRYRNPTYKNCTVCKEWHNFSNFYEWIIQEPNYEKWKKGKHWCLDKDIICKGNKEYSPEKCCLVSNELNVLFTKRQNDRGTEKVGVRYHKRDKIFEANISLFKKQKYIGRYNTEQEAFLAYKKEKEQYIKEVAKKEYAVGNISKACFEGMMNYKVEIGD